MGEWQELPVVIRTESPVLVAAKSGSGTMTASLDYFSGTIVRGLMAGRYIETQKLEQAEEDEAFRELFFSGLRFGAAYPLRDGERAMALPMSLQRSKDGSQVINLMQDKGAAGFKAMRGLGIISQGRITAVKVKKNISLHMSRSDQRLRDGSERLAGRSLTGGIFNYESIESGQEFGACIWGEREQLLRLKESLGGKSWEARIGRSKFTQYGRCEISLGEIRDISLLEQAAAENRICLRLETPFLPEQETADAMAALSILPQRLEQMTGDSFALDEQHLFARREAVDNFVGVWNMKRPREDALAAGSVFALKKSSPWKPEDWAALQQIMYEGIGRRRCEGFGQLRLWQGQNLSIAADEGQTAVPRRAVKNKQVCKKALQIISRRLLSAVENFAAEDAWEARNYLGESGRHFLSRLETVLQNAERRGGFEALRENLSFEVKGPATPFAKALGAIRINGKSLKAFWEEDQTFGDMPYWQEERQQVLFSAEVRQALKDLGIEQGTAYYRDSAELFYAYWRWFCRYGRKYARKLDV